MFRKIENILTNYPGPDGKKMKDKFMWVIEKNEGYKTIKSYYEVMSGKEDVISDITPTLLNCFKYAPITSVNHRRVYVYGHSGNSQTCKIQLCFKFMLKSLKIITNK
jgi:hypothetical protein